MNFNDIALVTMDARAVICPDTNKISPEFGPTRTKQDQQIFGPFRASMLVTSDSPTLIE